LFGSTFFTLCAASSTAKDEDPFLWLENVQGEKALGWVRDWNRRTTAELESVPEFETIRTRTLEILNSDDRIAVPDQMGNYVYNFWQDARNTRGLWRRMSLDDFVAGEPSWEVVLDIDQLAEAENENWVYKGSTCLYPEYRRCMIRLSRGGGDAVVQREFDTVSRQFVEDGFRLPEAKSRTSWRGPDSLWVGTDFGEGSLTLSGYPRQSKLWRRGEPLEDADLVFQGEHSDVAASAFSIHAPEGRYDLAMRSPTFFTGKLHLLRDGRPIFLDLPDDAEFQELFLGRLLVSLRSEWTAGGTTYPPDALISIELEEFLAGSRKFEILFQPGKRRSLSQVARTRTRLLLTMLDNVRSSLVELQLSANGWRRQAVDLPRFGTITVVSSSLESDDYFVSYTDFLTPTSLYLVRDSKPLLVKSLPSFFNAEGLEVSQLEAVSADGTAIPYFVVGPRELRADGAHPTLLHGYGGFEVSMQPRYGALTGVSWLERGGVYVLANIRGGGEFGAKWHQEALKENRHKAFEDFIAVAEDLIARKITSPPHLGIMGGSNGGLLVGTVFTRRPELFNAVVCKVPLLDMKRYSKLLAGASWMAEYGDPDDPRMWEYIRGYSPYHNLLAGKRYPRVFFATSTRDDRVHPGHARKMVARMTELGHPVLYYENTEGGHAGAANNEQRAYMTALEYAYLWKQLTKTA